ncbi:Isochorismatase hydrolase [Athelia psychrophila]|uniref:Isochorismatase hydrolase n=1 Tax=Athelia psychrophila TaxID=1759441 RepID=A0A165ZDX8_9AGAM|nr:Isochorismatase hydrolase [Fibularhizoctonia sp. CBS 109695]
MQSNSSDELEASSTATRRVLLLLDIQIAMLDSPPKGVHSAPTVRENVWRILSHARSANPPPLIVHVRNTGEQGDNDEPHTPGWDLVFPPLSHEPVIDKLKNNAFAGTRLTSLITPDAEIVVVGMQTDYCIRATCSAALGRGNEVLLIKGAHATYDGMQAWNGGVKIPASKIEADTEAELEEAGVVLMDMSDIPGIFANR